MNNNTKNFLVAYQRILIALAVSCIRHLNPNRLHLELSIAVYMAKLSGEKTCSLSLKTFFHKTSNK